MYLFRNDLEHKNAVVINVPHTKIMMCLNESTLNPMDVIQEQLLRKLKDVPLNRYFNTVTTDLKRTLAEYVGHRVKPEQILFGNGADEMLYYIFTAVRENPDSFAVALAPSYFDYKSYSDAVGLGIHFHDLDTDFQFDADAFLAMTRHSSCKLAILCNPNNPTGNLMPPEKIEYIVSHCDKLVLLDETYFEFSGQTFMDQLSKYSNLVIVRSFSKAFSSASLRFGYLITSEENAIELNKVMTAFHSSLLIQTFALTILENRTAFLAHVERVKALREELYQKLAAIPTLTVHPTHTNFLIFTIGEKTSQLFEDLVAHDIAVRPVGGHPLLRNYLRVTIGTEEQNHYFIETVTHYLNKE